MKTVLGCIIILMKCVLCTAWSGIIHDAQVSDGGTQMIFINQVPHVQGGVNLGLSNHQRCKAVVKSDGKLYFVGGRNTTLTYGNVRVFDPVTNTTSILQNLNVARYGHGATVVNDTIFVCGGEKLFKLII
jgi:hypothetical protein